MLPVTKSTDLLDGPQNTTKCLLSPFISVYLRLMEQNILINATPVNVFPVPKTVIKRHMDHITHLIYCIFFHLEHLFTLYPHTFIFLIMM